MCEVRSICFNLNRCNFTGGMLNIIYQMLTNFSIWRCCYILILAFNRHCDTVGKLSTCNLFSIIALSMWLVSGVDVSHLGYKVVEKCVLLTPKVYYTSVSTVCHIVFTLISFMLM